MSLSSAFAIHVLELEETDNLLDLCCAPGNKLCLASSLIGSKGSVTGVDVSKHRLHVCESMVKKYKVPNVRLFLQDARTFDELALVRGTKGVVPKCHWQSSVYRKYPCCSGDELYDKVIVDAECTNDGSVKHMQKQMKKNWKNFNFDLLSTQRLADLYKLQLELLENGFRLLKVNGILVYSTCSMSEKQNDEIVLKFLQLHSNARVLPIEIDDRHKKGLFVVFDPRKGDTDGFFIAKIIKYRE